MRILQLIDSLEAGGAERMAVNYANALQNEVSFAALCATRKEGALKQALLQDVHYLFLNKKKAIDFGAILRLYSFVKKNKIEFIHAHSSSFFTAVLLKFIYPKIKIVWHDHYGNSEFLEKRNVFFLKSSSYLFASIISVNQQLKRWAVENLNCKNVAYLPNFVAFNNDLKSVTRLKGVSGKQILCLANLREQKGHFFLLEIASEIKKKHPDWTFHLVGKDFKDTYSSDIKAMISNKKLSDHVFIYDSKTDVKNIISQAEICILSSASEGLPVALLEYGYNAKPVLATNVGEISSVIDNEINGYIADYNDLSGYLKYLDFLINSAKTRIKIGNTLQKNIYENFSKEAILHKYINFLHDAYEK